MHPNSDADPVAGETASPPTALTAIVHKAIVSLCTSSVIIPDPRYTVAYQRLFPAMNHNLRSAYKNAAIFLLLGFEFDFEAVYLNRGHPQHLERMINMVNSLPRSTPAALESAGRVYRSAIGVEWIGVDPNSWKHLTETTKDLLSRNAQDLDWCNVVWSRLFATGAAKADIVNFFVSIIMTAMQVRCPIQEFPSQWFTLGNTRTFDELWVMQLSADIRKKPDWRRELRDDAIVSKWRDDALNDGATPSMIDFLIGELLWFADELDPDTGIDHSTVPGVFYSDILIPATECDALREGANMLAAVPDNEKDWHPNSNGQVLDLVHPSLYPYVRGRTPRFLYAEESSGLNAEPEMTPAKIDAVATSILHFLDPSPLPPSISSPAAALEVAGKGVATSASMAGADIMERKWRSNSKYQWLPVDVEVSSDLPRSVRFLSYVNNLHPASGTPGGSLYPILERIFACFVPLFERALTETRRRPTGDAGKRTQFLHNSVEDYWDPPAPNYDALDGSDTETAYDELRDDWKANRKFIPPVVGPFVPPGPAEPAQVKFGGKTIQVIIKMANVHLTPENPEYAGGMWHVEGTENERIVATGIYYYESEAVEEPAYEQYEHEHLEELYGMTPALSNDGTHANQSLGGIPTPEGRCICFPNGIQHRLSPFKIEDPTKPGHRKILVFFLVDPSQRVLCTSDVPPQQMEWVLNRVRNQGGTRLSLMPPELFNLVCEHLKALSYIPLGSEGKSSSTWLMSLEEAKERRLELMGERADFAGKVNANLYERRFNLCEH